MIKVKTLEEDLNKGDNDKSKKYQKIVAKDKRLFCLIGIDFIVKKENKSHLFYFIYLIFHLIPKIYFKQYGWEGW